MIGLGRLFLVGFVLCWGCDKPGEAENRPTQQPEASPASSIADAASRVADKAPPPDARAERTRSVAAGGCRVRWDCHLAPGERLRFAAMCLSGKCAKVALPRLTPCAKDSDCVITSLQRGRCCGLGCGPYKNAHHKADIAVLRQWRERYCAKGTYTCKQYRCPKRKSATKAVCRRRRCRAIEHRL